MRFLLKPFESRIHDQQSQRDNGIFLVNPRIIYRSPELEMLVWTAPEFRATLLRDAEVIIEYESLECLDGSSLGSCGSTKQITFQGELARCTQHEMDHDRGRLIVDHVPLDELLSIDGNPFMAKIEDTDGLHPMRMHNVLTHEKLVIQLCYLLMKKLFIWLWKIIWDIAQG